MCAIRAGVSRCLLLAGDPFQSRCRIIQAVPRKSNLCDESYGEEGSLCTDSFFQADALLGNGNGVYYGDSSVDDRESPLKIEIKVFKNITILSGRKSYDW